MRNNNHTPALFRPAESFSPVTLRIFSFVYFVFALFFAVMAIGAFGNGINILGFLSILPSIYGVIGFIRMSQIIPAVQQAHVKNIVQPKQKSAKASISALEKPVSEKMQAARKKTKQLDILPVYKERLMALNEFAVDLADRMDSMEYFLDEYFGNSNISKSRYLQVTKDAQKLLENNYKKATQAALMFGTKSKPTPERIQILDNYVNDSQDVADKMEIVINQLVAVQQNDTIRAGDILDASLEELARTTKYYSKESLD